MLSLILTLAGLIPSLLPKLGVSSSISNLVQAALSAASALFQAHQSGTSEVGAVLTSLQLALTAVETDTTIAPADLAEISEALRVVKTAILAYQAAQVTDDPSTLTPLPLLG